MLWFMSGTNHFYLRLFLFYDFDFHVHIYDNSNYVWFKVIIEFLFKDAIIIFWVSIWKSIKMHLKLLMDYNISLIFVAKPHNFLNIINFDKQSTTFSYPQDLMTIRNHLFVSISYPQQLYSFLQKPKFQIS